MIKISYTTMITFISILWCLVRAWFAIKNKKIDWKREAQLILVYICIIVVARFVFFPFSKVDGQIQPLIFDSAKAFPFRINLIPFVHMTDYVIKREAVINFVGNTAMFIPLGIVWPSVYKGLDTHLKVVLAGVGCSLCIEILQLPFYDRVSDIDDLILNSLGYIIGYLIYLGVKGIRSKKNNV